jgi:FkbM family methyltransferase
MRLKLLSEIEANLSQRIGIETYCKTVNFRNAVRGKRQRIAPVESEDPAIHLASDGTDSIYICRRGRHNRYRRGVMAGVDQLARDYSLDLISNLREGMFIDCGANVGELGFWARQRGFKYVPFEPETLESRCIYLNHFEGAAHCIRKALWKEETVLKFYNRPDSADSSVLPDDEDEPAISIDATTLDAAVDLSAVTGPLVFKLEAEGAEPEVLEGAVKSLSRLDWIAVDCGYERDPERARTFVETNTFLHDHGFRLVAAKFQRITALYKRGT